MDDKTYESMKRDVERISIVTIKSLEEEIRVYLNKCGLFYKIFTRIKSSNSIRKKVLDREDQGKHNYKIQDLIGVRIVLYFKSDIKLCQRLIEQNNQIIDYSIDDEEPDKFKAQRINYVCKLPENVKNNFDSNIWKYPIDETFEIQMH